MGVRNIITCILRRRVTYLLATSVITGAGKPSDENGTVPRIEICKATDNGLIVFKYG